MISFFKTHATFCVSALLALATCFIVPPSREYLNYIDVKTLGILFALMATVQGLEKCSVFVQLGKVLTSLVRTVRSLSFVLVFLCFFLSMFITNDVALLTFVPFAIMLLGKQKLPAHVLVLVVVLQTIAANTGSMLTPIGNPQNLFIFNKTGMNVVDFMGILLPYTIVCGVLLAALGFLIPKTELVLSKESTLFEKSTDVQKIKFAVVDRVKQTYCTIPLLKILYFALFGICLLSVFKVLPNIVAALIVFVAVLIFDRKTLLKVDYFLLLTFVAFFIFSGNIANISFVKEFLEKSVLNHEFFSGLLVSQVISNVPATLMLFNFCSDVEGLLIGVDVGGLGTLVASLASLISFNIYTKEKKNGLKFLWIFTVLNVFFLIVLIFTHKLFL